MKTPQSAGQVVQIGFSSVQRSAEQRVGRDGRRWKHRSKDVTCYGGKILIELRLSSGDQVKFLPHKVTEALGLPKTYRRNLE